MPEIADKGRQDHDELGRTVKSCLGGLDGLRGNSQRLRKFEMSKSWKSERYYE